MIIMHLFDETGKDQVGLCNALKIKAYFHFNDDSMKLTYQKNNQLSQIY